MRPGQLKLTGPLLAAIFLGDIKKWNDPQIVAINRGLPLPNLPITVVHRSDGSGTSFIFTSYLSLKSPAWKTKVGAGTAVAWPTGLGGKGNEGVAAFTKQTIGSIGYVEFAYALPAKPHDLCVDAESPRHVRCADFGDVSPAAAVDAGIGPGGADVQSVVA